MDGAIGLRATGSIARTIMGFILEEVQQIMIDNNMPVHLLKKYVDDILMITDRLQLGARYCKHERKIKVTQSDADQDQIDGKSREQETYEVMREVANSVLKFIKFEGEYSVEGNPIPCLDMEIWVGRPTASGPWYKAEMSKQGETVPGRQRSPSQHRQVLYRFYKKPMAATLTMLARSAIPEGSKVATVSAEIIRRLKRTSTFLGTGVFEQIIRKYMDDLAAMGFSHQWRKKVLTSTMTGYRRILYRESQGTTPRNRLGKDTALARRVKRLCGKSTWFTKRADTSDRDEIPAKKGTKSDTRQQAKVVKTAIFIPITENSVLKKMLQVEEKNH